MGEVRHGASTFRIRKGDWDYVTVWYAAKGLTVPTPPPPAKAHPTRCDVCQEELDAALVMRNSVLNEGVEDGRMVPHRPDAEGELCFVRESAGGTKREFLRVYAVLVGNHFHYYKGGLQSIGKVPATGVIHLDRTSTVEAGSPEAPPDDPTLLREFPGFDFDFYVMSYEATTAIVARDEVERELWCAAMNNVIKRPFGRFCVYCRQFVDLDQDANAGTALSEATSRHETVTGELLYAEKHQSRFSKMLSIRGSAVGRAKVKVRPVFAVLHRGHLAIFESKLDFFDGCWAAPLAMVHLHRAAIFRAPDAPADYGFRGTSGRFIVTENFEGDDVRGMSRRVHALDFEADSIPAADRWIELLEAAAADAEPGGDEEPEPVGGSAIRLASSPRKMSSPRTDEASSGDSGSGTASPAAAGQHHSMVRASSSENVQEAARKARAARSLRNGRMGSGRARTAELSTDGANGRRAAAAKATLRTVSSPSKGLPSKGTPQVGTFAAHRRLAVAEAAEYVYTPRGSAAVNPADVPTA